MVSTPYYGVRQPPRVPHPSLPKGAGLDPTSTPTQNDEHRCRVPHPSLPKGAGLDPTSTQSKTTTTVFLWNPTLRALCGHSPPSALNSSLRLILTTTLFYSMVPTPEEKRNLRHTAHAHFSFRLGKSYSLLGSRPMLSSLPSRSLPQTSVHSSTPLLYPLPLQPLPPSVRNYILDKPMSFCKNGVSWSKRHESNRHSQ
jgi:hypothetical protein